MLRVGSNADQIIKIKRIAGISPSKAHVQNTLDTLEKGNNAACRGSRSNRKGPFPIKLRQSILNLEAGLPFSLTMATPNRRITGPPRNRNAATKLGMMKRRFMKPALMKYVAGSNQLISKTLSILSKTLSILFVILLPRKDLTSDVAFSTWDSDGVGWDAISSFASAYCSEVINSSLLAKCFANRGSVI